jgi:hypothetical protein
MGVIYDESGCGSGMGEDPASATCDMCGETGMYGPDAVPCPNGCTPSPESQTLDELIAQSKVRLAAMTEEERQAMWQAQRESMVRAMTTGCDHGVLDFEDCPQCRNISPSPKERGR